MQPIKIVSFLLVVLLFGCAKDKKYVEPQTEYCQSQMIKNQYIVHWKKNSPTLITDSKIEEFIHKNSELIDFVEPNYAVQTDSIAALEDNSISANNVYDMIHVRSAWYRGYFGQGLTIAVIDTGIDMKHPALRRRLLQGWNFVSDSEQILDETGHGTAMAGIITGPYLNNSSLSLAPDVRILPIDFMAEHGGTEYHAQQAVAYAVSRKIKIINNSWTVSCSELLRNSFIDWSHEDIVFVNSSGNEPVDVILRGIIPASLSLSNHIHVGSLDGRGHKSSFSGFGNTVQVYAPGEYVPTYAISGTGVLTVRVSGTSVSTAIVSAAVALLWSAYPEARAVDIVSLIVDGTLQEPTVEPMLNIRQSLKLARERFSDNR